MGETLPKRILRCLWCLLIFALPFRWNYAVASAEQPLFPLNIQEWIFFAIQPHFLLCVIAGILLLATIAIYPIPPKRNASLAIPILTLAPLFFGLAGMVHTTEFEYAVNWYWHFYAIACVSFGLWWTSNHDRKLIDWGVHAIALGGFFTAFHGWTQHFGGLEAQLEAQMENAKVTGIHLTEQMIAKLQQTRSYGLFADPNAYAAQLLLASPFMILDAVRIGKRCTTPKPACILLGGTAALLSFGALIFSGSRGAVLGAMCGMLLAAFYTLGKRLAKTWKIALAAIAVACACGMIFAVNKLSRRKMETVTIRMEYYGTAWQIYKANPLFGAGLGEFFPWHMRLKPWEGDDARDPHSLFFAQLSQCGLPGAFDAFLRLGAPLLLAFGLFKTSRHKDKWQVTATLGAWCAWNAHALTQFNDMIISTATMAGFIGLFLFDNSHADTCSRHTTRSVRLADGAMIIMALAAISALWRIPGGKAKQIADNYRTSRASYATCREAFSKAIDKNPRAVLPPRILCDLALQANDLATAESAVEQMRRISPHRASTYIRALRLSMLQKNSKAEKSALSSLQEWYPTSPELWLLKAAPPTPFQADLLSLHLEKIHATADEVLFEASLPPNNAYLSSTFPCQTTDDATGKTIRFELHQ